MSALPTDFFKHLAEGQLSLPAEVALTSPTNGRRLTLDTWLFPGTGILSDGQELWPIVEGIPFLRIGRDELRRKVVNSLRHRRHLEALAYLLQDQDDFAPDPPPTLDQVHTTIEAVQAGCSLQRALKGLRFGPVSHYFLNRLCTPTFLSGIGLLAQYADRSGLIVELACGIGQFLEELRSRGTACLGIDVVFAKLWLARKFVCPQVPLVCVDLSHHIPMERGQNDPATVYCHDAFYFFPKKLHVIAESKRLAGNRGRLLIGHAHNRQIEHGVAGSPLTPDEYQQLLPTARLFDDHDFVDTCLAERAASPKSPALLGAVEAVSLVWSGSEEFPSQTDGCWDLTAPAAGTALSLNPLLQEHAGVLTPVWPMPCFEAEYKQATYLRGETIPSDTILQAAADGAVGTGQCPEVDRLARRRIFLPRSALYYQPRM